jgi:organic radical activating enzyme
MSDFFCAAPWRGLHINPRGDVKTCCAGNPNMLGNLNSNTIEDILNGDIMREVRRSISQGQAHSYCSNCVQAERFGADGERQWHNSVNPDFDYTTAGELYHYPVIFDVRWNTTCNLSCNYCGEACSSRWAAIKGTPFRSGTRPYFDSVCDFLDQHREHIHEVALVGGEPLLLPENDRLLDVIPDSAIVTLITNLNVDFERNKIVQKLCKRSKVGWSISFENIGARFEYVRHGADWNMMKNNIALVKQLMREQGHWGGAHAVYNIYNATRLCEFREFLHEQGLTVVWQNLFQPDYLDPFQHGDQVAALAAEEAQRFLNSGLATPVEQIFFQRAIDTYTNKADHNWQFKQKFAQHIELIEQVYHRDSAGKFVQLWPELEFLIS